MKANRLGLVLFVTGASGLAGAFWGLFHDIESVAQPFYVYAWWSYILLLDGFCALRRGRSLLTTHFGLFVPLCVSSVTFWFFFELLNLRFQNWYYVGVFAPHDLPGQLGAAAFTVASFATVFMGIFETYDALTAAGLWRRWRGRADGKLPSWVSYSVQGLGAAMAATAVFFPYYLAPLIWGSLTFLVDPWNYRRDARSILRDIEVRDWGLVARVFVAGLICGLVWESCNFYAPQKWIYTVRGLEELKLFEMPLLGFLGFPGLAYDSIAAFSLVSWMFLGNRTWEHPHDLRYTLETRPQPARWTLGLSILPQVGLWVVVVLLLIEVNIGSLQLELGDLGFDSREIQSLEKFSVRRPRQLYRETGSDEGFERVQAALGCTSQRLTELRARVEFWTFKGMGSVYGPILERVGVRRVEDLRNWQPEALHDALREEASLGGDRPPPLRFVRVWVLASRG
jgi:hypothetical protein